jgi:hypothetical protein
MGRAKCKQLRAATKICRRQISIFVPRREGATVQSLPWPPTGRAVSSHFALKLGTLWLCMTSTKPSLISDHRPQVDARHNKMGRIVPLCVAMERSAREESSTWDSSRQPSDPLKTKEVPGSHIIIEPNPAPSFRQACRQSGSSDGRTRLSVAVPFGLWFAIGSWGRVSTLMGTIDKMVRRCACQIHGFQVRIRNTCK